MAAHRVAAVLTFFFSAGCATTAYEGSDGYSAVTEEDNTPQLDYDDPYWCHPLSLTNGEVTCTPPRGGRYRSSLGSRCQMTCDRGYRVMGRSSVQCLASRRWSGTAFCRTRRCHVLPLIPHGRYSCNHGFLVNSRCDFTCRPGYILQGQHSLRICLHSGLWTSVQPVCADVDPPKITCPQSKLKMAEPGKLTARVSWETPVAKDTADKTLNVILVGQEPDTDFNEGANIIRYKVYDEARNRAACKFIVRVEVRRCPPLPPPLRGFLTCSSDRNNYGATCEYHCQGGYERRGVSSRVCQFNRSWEGDAAECVAMEIKSDVKTLSALMDQFYEKRRILIVSAPDLSDPDYKLQNIMLQKADCGLDLRQVTVIELLDSPPREIGRIKEGLLSAEVVQGLRHVFRITRSYFSMVLVDKLGQDRERFVALMGAMDLFSYIDGSLLEEDEREKLELHRYFCEEPSVETE
ncbi:sushi repeat-containing protein SRPX2 [Genypterus blacodes]|uniref:sushi repeat-containing protein SRPX2 n=1 Tax=Genypterus blacodes TaxID=154954 RepID=UPI003F76CBD1